MIELKDKLQAAVKTEKLPSIHTKKGKQIATNIAKRVINGEQSLDSVPRKYYSYIQGEVRGAEPVRRAREEVAQEISPVVSGLAFGPAGVVAALTGEAVNMGVNATTHGEKRSWGDIFADPEKHPIWNTVWNFTNPGYFLAGGIKPSKPTNVGVRLLKGETPEHIIKTSVKEFENGINKTKIPGEVKYYGPTMGKTTAVKTNPNLVDFDDVMRQPSKELLKKYGFNSKYEMFESGNQKAIQEYQDLLVSKMKEFKADPKNSGKTLVVSQNPVVNPKVTGFQFDNTPSIPTRNVFIQRNIGRGGDYEGSAGWYDNLIKSNPNLRIDNRFVSEIEGNKVVNTPIQSLVSPQQAATTYHFDPRVKRISVLTNAEIEGRPKFMRNQFKLTPEQYRTVLNDANDFARKYGYQEIPDTPDALQQIQNMYRRHNTFVRSVPKSRVEVDPEYGLSPIDWPKWAENLTEQERAYIAATKGYPAQMQDRVFVSSTPESVKYYGDQIGDYNFAVRRPISLGHDPLQWRSWAEFNIEGPITGYTTPTSIFRADNLSDPKFELMLGTGNLSAKPLISETQITGAFNSPANEPLIGWLQQQGYKLPRKHLRGEDTVQMKKRGGIIKAQKGTSFEHYLNTLPENQKDSTYYNVKRYWELNGKPKDFKEAINKNMFRFDETDGYWHANSIAYNKETGEYEFMKKPTHKTLQLELDEYNRNSDFNSKYKLDTLSTPWKYVKK